MRFARTNSKGDFRILSWALSFKWNDQPCNCNWITIQSKILFCQWQVLNGAVCIHVYVHLSHLLNWSVCIIAVWETYSQLRESSSTGNKTARGLKIVTLAINVIIGTLYYIYKHLSVKLPFYFRWHLFELLKALDFFTSCNFCGSKFRDLNTVHSYFVISLRTHPFDYVKTQQDRSIKGDVITYRTLITPLLYHWDYDFIKHAA